MEDIDDLDIVSRDPADRVVPDNEDGMSAEYLLSLGSTDSELCAEYESLFGEKPAIGKGVDGRRSRRRIFDAVELAKRNAPTLTTEILGSFAKDDPDLHKLNRTAEDA